MLEAGQEVQGEHEEQEEVHGLQVHQMFESRYQQVEYCIYIKVMERSKIHLKQYVSDDFQCCLKNV